MLLFTLTEITLERIMMLVLFALIALICYGIIHIKRRNAKQQPTYYKKQTDYDSRYLLDEDDELKWFN